MKQNGKENAEDETGLEIARGEGIRDLKIGRIWEKTLNTVESDSVVDMEKSSEIYTQFFN